MIYVLAAGLILLSLGAVEYRLHRRNLAKIPTVVHVNGTRGKSTTTRLIAAGLRGAGLNVLAKTTGSAARLILSDGEELPLHRRGRATIHENLKVVAWAARRGVDVLVVECMALHPELQWIAEEKMLQADLAVITNVREDHLEVMGPTVADAARFMCATIPQRGHLVTAEKQFLPVLQEAAAKKGTTVHVVDPEGISPAVLDRFSYISFGANVALALKVCELLGVDQETALTGMLQAAPDPGVSPVQHLRWEGRSVQLLNCFAANDPQSTLMTWEAGRSQLNLEKALVCAVLNSRSDRPLRVLQLAGILGELGLEKQYLVGEWTWQLKRKVREAYPGPVLDLTRAKTAEEIVRCIAAQARRGVVLVGLGNIRGMGEALLQYFKENGED